MLKKKQDKSNKYCYIWTEGFYLICKIDRGEFEKFD